MVGLGARDGPANAANRGDGRAAAMADTKGQSGANGEGDSSAIVDAVLRGSATVAVVGVSNQMDRPAYELAAFLQDEGVTIVPVHLTERTVLEERAYPSVRAIPPELPVDTVCVCVRPDQLPIIVGDVLARGGILQVWVQPGSEDADAIAIARAAGLVVVAGREWMDEYSKRMRE